METKRIDDRGRSETCQKCDGTGFVAERTSAGRVLVRPCDACNELRNSHRRTLYLRSGIPRRASNEINVCRATRDYADSFPQIKRGNNWLLYIGKPGAGKTTQAIWLVCALIDRYQTRARFYNAFDLVRRFGALRKRNEDFERAFDEYLDAELVVIDDLFKIIPSEKAFNYSDYKETLLELIWARYDARKPLVITTQRDFNVIARFDSALAGRIVESCAGRVVPFDSQAKNWRSEPDGRFALPRGW